jgi:hypothetical protein
MDASFLGGQDGNLYEMDYEIEFQVKQAGNFIEEANVDVHESIEYQKNIRKKQCSKKYICVDGYIRSDHIRVDEERHVLCTLLSRGWICALDVNANENTNGDGNATQQQHQGMIRLAAVMDTAKTARFFSSIHTVRNIVDSRVSS